MENISRRILFSAGTPWPSLRDQIAPIQARQKPQAKTAGSFRSLLPTRFSPPSQPERAGSSIAMLLRGAEGQPQSVLTLLDVHLVHHLIRQKEPATAIVLQVGEPLRLQDPAHVIGLSTP